MDKQLIISVGREFGSGGHVIAEDLARRFALPLYDYNLLEHIAEEKDIAHEELKKYDEKPKSRLFRGPCAVIPTPSRSTWRRCSLIICGRWRRREDPLWLSGAARRKF